MQREGQLTNPSGPARNRRPRRTTGGPAQVRNDRRHPPALFRLSDETRRTGREGVAMARRELRRAMNAEHAAA